MSKVIVQFVPETLYCPVCQNPMIRTRLCLWMCIDRNCDGYHRKYAMPTVEVEQWEDEKEQN